MTVQARAGGSWKAIVGANAFSGGAWRSIVAVKVFAGGVWRTAANFSPSGPGGGGSGTLTVSASPSSLIAEDTSSTITSAPEIIATPSGGTAPYTYLWSIVSSDPGPTYTINTPTLASTNVTAAGIGPVGASVTCTIHCVATDSLGTVSAPSNAVPITFDHGANNPGSQ